MLRDNPDRKISKLEHVIYAPSTLCCSVAFNLSNSMANHTMWVTYIMAGGFWIVSIDGKIKFRSTSSDSLMCWLEKNVGLAKLIGRKLSRRESSLVNGR